MLGRKILYSLGSNDENLEDYLGNVKFILLDGIDEHFDPLSNIDAIISLIYLDDEEDILSFLEFIKLPVYTPQKFLVGSSLDSLTCVRKHANNHDISFGCFPDVTTFLEQIKEEMRSIVHFGIGNRINSYIANQTLNLHCISSTTNEHGVIIHANKKFCEISGYELHELVGNTHNIVNSGIHPRHFFEDLWKTIESGKTWQGEICNRKQNGEYYWVESTIVPYQTKAGEKRYVSLRTDITETKNLQLLEKQRNLILEKQQKFIFDLSLMISEAENDIFSICSHIGQFLCSEMHARSFQYFSVGEEVIEPLYCSNFSYKFDNTPKMNMSDPKNIDSFIQKGASLFGTVEDLRPYSKELYDYLKHLEKGKHFVMGITNETQSHPRGIAVIEKNDLSEQDKVFLQSINSQLSTYYLVEKIRGQNQKLSYSEKSLKLSAKFANIGYWDWHIDTGQLFWSDQIANLFGYQSSIPETTYQNFMNIIHPEDKHLVQEAVNGCIHKNTEYNIEHRVIWEDGSIHWLHECGDVLRDETDRPVRMLGVVRDITKQRLAEEATIEAKEAAVNSNRAKSQFISSMSHELRTPMNSILGFTQLLQSAQLDERPGMWVSEINLAAQHLLQLINDILDLAKIDSNSFRFDMNKVSVDRMFSSVISLTSSIRQKHNAFISAQNDNKNGTVLADEMRLRQVLVNLVSNAVKYGNGKITLSSRLENQCCVFEVEDNGPGIPLELQNKVFSAFDRLGRERSDIEGSGIGLLIARRLVELMQGKIGFTTSNKGTKFWIKLPTPIEDRDKVPVCEEIPEQNIFTGKSILYIEDNQASVNLVENIFEPYSNLKLYTACSIEDAIKVANSFNIDLYLVDINLPDGNGFEFLSLLRRKSEAPAIVLSATTNKSVINKAKNEGFFHYITKPYRIQTLLGACSSAFSGTELQ